MPAIAEQLDAKLKTLDAKAAATLEKLLRDALELADAQTKPARPDRLQPDFFCAHRLRIWRRIF